MINILAENNYFIVLDKPAGTSVHNEEPNLLTFLKKQNLPVHFVNRLDTETSGLVMIAKKPDFHEPLRQALDHGQKIYSALLRGKMKTVEIDWSWALTDKAEGRQNPQGSSADRKPCLSHVKVIRQSDYLTEVSVEIATGRQHQIRKHAALAKHPIIGDRRYNDAKYNQKIAEIYQDSRMQLHAQKLIFKFNDTPYDIESSHFSLDHFFKI